MKFKSKIFTLTIGLVVITVFWTCRELVTFAPVSGHTAEEKKLTETELLHKMKKNLETREKELSARENEIRKKERQLGDKEKEMIAEFKRYQRELESLKGKKRAIASEESADEEHQEFIKIYQNMDAKRAARILDGMEVDLAGKLLKGMRATKSAEILGRMSSTKARAITKKFSGLAK